MKTAGKSGRDCIRFHLLTPANTVIPMLTATKSIFRKPPYQIINLDYHILDIFVGKISQKKKSQAAVISMCLTDSIYSYLLCHINSIPTDIYASLQVTTDDRGITISKFLVAKDNNSFKKGKSHTTQKRSYKKRIYPQTVYAMFSPLTDVEKQQGRLCNFNNSFCIQIFMFIKTLLLK